MNALDNGTESCENFKRELAAVFNKHSIDAHLNMPDIFVADMISGILSVIRQNKTASETWRRNMSVPPLFVSSDESGKGILHTVYGQAADMGVMYQNVGVPEHMVITQLTVGTNEGNKAIALGDLISWSQLWSPFMHSFSDGKIMALGHDFAVIEVQNSDGTKVLYSKNPTNLAALRIDKDEVEDEQ